MVVQLPPHRRQLYSLLYPWHQSSINQVFFMYTRPESLSHLVMISKYFSRSAISVVIGKICDRQTKVKHTQHYFVVIFCLWPQCHKCQVIDSNNSTFFIEWVKHFVHFKSILLLHLCEGNKVWTMQFPDKLPIIERKFPFIPWK